MAKKYLLLLVSVFCFCIFNVAKAQCSITPGFTAPSVCFGAPVGFTNTTTGGVVNFLWRFGDSTTSTAVSPTHIYAYAGTFKVTLIAGASPCIDSTSQMVNVFPLPIADFAIVGNDCGQVCVNFIDLSTISSDTIATWYWSFGDGTTSGMQNPSHCYAASGIYIVHLTVTSNHGCSQMVIKNDTIFPQPIASFIAAPNPVKAGSLVTFTDTNKYISKVFYLWSFGDGATDTAMNPMHSYSSNGTYYASLVVTNSYGCSDTTTVAIIVGPVGIQSINNSIEGIIIYPNPSNGKFTIKSSVVSGQSTVEIYNVLGEKVYSNTSATHFPMSIDISTEPIGLYFVKVNTGQSSKMMKYIKE